MNEWDRMPGPRAADAATADSARLSTEYSGGTHWSLRERRFGVALVAILLGYAFLGKGFAYLHIPLGLPLYVGEIILGLGLLMMFLRHQAFQRALRNVEIRALLLFLVWGIIRTLPHLGQYGIDALRDAAFYYYGLFTLLVYELLRSKDQLQRIGWGYYRITGAFVWWVPVAFGLHVFAQDVLPRTPGTDMPLLWVKGGDAAVHLIAAVAFASLASAYLPMRKREGRGILWYCVPVVSIICFGGRAAYLAFAAGFATMIALRERGKVWKPVMAAVLSVAAFAAVNPKLVLPSDREISAEVTTGLVRSVFTASEDPRFREGTKQWRLMWWAIVIDETVFGEYFWTGRGFGENLADVHGFQTADPNDPHQLRSPHSSHITVLSRMGVPGLLLWILLHGVLVRRFYSGWRRARDAGDRFVQGVLTWVLCYWVASLVNSSFDVYFEGPQGAVWFWSMMGLGLAAADLSASGNGARLSGPRIPAAEVAEGEREGRCG